MSRIRRVATAATLILLAATTTAQAAGPPATPTCNRGTGYSYTAPPGTADAGTVYGASGPCRMTRYDPATTPRGTIMYIAAGGWQSLPPYTDTPQVKRIAKVWTDAGYQMIAVEVTSAVVNGVTGGGANQYSNMIQWFDVIRWWGDAIYGTSYKVCSSGGSSGGHMALMLATLRLPDCIVVEAAPTNLAALNGFNNNFAYNAAVGAFGAANLAQWSPASYTAPYFGMPILMGALPDDVLVPPSQMSNFASTHPTVTTMTLTPTGGWPVPECNDYATWIERTFAHLCSSLTNPPVQGQQQAGVTAASIAAWRAEEVAFVNAVP